MSTFYIVTGETAELMHHGIKGMKWGVRRYQNYDGTYTKKGLERYRSSEKNYNDAKKRLSEDKSFKKNAKLSDNYEDYVKGKIQVKQSKKDVKESKKQLERDYKKLKTDKKADQGKELYKSGKSIKDNRAKSFYIGLGSMAVTELLSYAAKNTGHEYINIKGLGEVNVPQLLGVADFAIGAAVTAKITSENKKLRAYYAH